MTTVLRPVTRADLPQVLALQQRSFQHDGVPTTMDLDELEEEFDDDRVVLATDTRIAERDGEMVGFAYTFHLPSDVREERCYIFGQVHPLHRRTGVGTMLMEWGIARAEEQLRSTGRALPLAIRTDRYDYITGAHALFAHVGMVPVRYMDELLRPLDELPPLRAPDGLRIVPWAAERDEQIRAAKNISFADHWGSTPTSAANWHHMVHGFGARPDLSFIVLDEHDRVVAHCLNHRYELDDEHTGRRDAWIENLGTLPEWRGKGLASALIAHSLHAFAAAGFTHAAIQVDSENPTGAAQLYRRLGFEPNQRSITHEIVLR